MNQLFGAVPSTSIPPPFKVQVEVTLRQSVGMTWYRAHAGTFDQILLPVEKFAV
jgi:hypothetical protein